MTDRAYEKDTAWKNATPPALPPIATDHTAAVCVVGAGISGLTAAYLLAREGRTVIVLDDGAVGGGESGLTTAHVVNALDRRWSELAKAHSPENLRLAATSHTAAIDTIEKIVDYEAIHCDFRRVDGYLFAAPGTPKGVLEEEVRAAHLAGLAAVAEVPRAPLRDFDTGPAVLFPRQAQLHILRYLAALSRAIEREGGRIYTHAHVTSVDEEEKVDHVIVKTAQGASVIANEVVLAVNSPFVPRISTHLKQAGYRTYAIALRIKRNAVPAGLYWDTADPFHYVRVADTDGPDELLIVGGEDHKVGQATDAKERHGRLEAWARERFPRAGGIVHRWSGEVMETVDGLAYIGRMRKGSRVHVITGDCGNGITHGTIAGLIIADLVHGRENPWAELYSPTRANLHPRPAAQFVKENLNMAAHYAAWLSRGEIDDPAELAPNTGALLRRGLEMVAVYRDPEGKIHERSAACTHMGCVVAWNTAERTWDCPCHGARFSATGRVIHGPATADLRPAKARDPERS